MIWLVFGLLMISAIVGCVLIKKTGDDDWLYLAVPCGVFAVVLLIVLPIATMSNSVDFVELEAFYQVNSGNYEIAVDDTASYLSTEDFKQALIAGSIEKFELAGYVSERISEWRDAVNQYNRAIARMKYWDSNIFFGILCPDGVRDAKLLTLD